MKTEKDWKFKWSKSASGLSDQNETEYSGDRSDVACDALKYPEVQISVEEKAEIDERPGSLPISFGTLGRYFHVDI